ncbi:uncharacterized protein LOC134529559 [Bacillus rossius redtenbacheri]|uniref:uncharacterized protein LOC134529559 n=1 Tax=Bacillus rossius redtenbacheri TaxID=93214 RepID=UPI002FDE5419
MLEMKIMEVKAVKGATKSFATDLKHSLDSRLGELEKTEIFLVATMLDPRYKHHPFQNPDSTETVKNSLNDSMTLQKCDQTSESTGTSRCAISSPGPSATQKGIWQMFQKMVDKSIAATTASTRGNVIEELDSYMKQPTFDLGTYPIEFWLKDVNYPHLKKAALKNLIIPLGSVYSERLLSSAGNILQEKRNRMLPENLRKLVFLNSNLPVLNYDY